METYSITINSSIDSNVGKTLYFNSNLNKEILLDVLTPITPYQVKINEKPNVIVLWDLEDIIRNLLGVKLTTKVARNVIKLESEILATFKEKPNLDLNKWEGNSGEIRTYINNIGSITIVNTIFPRLFKVDAKSSKAYYPGKLTIEHDPIANNYMLIGTKLTETVVYEEITLEK